MEFIHGNPETAFLECPRRVQNAKVPPQVILSTRSVRSLPSPFSLCTDKGQVHLAVHDKDAAMKSRFWGGCRGGGVSPVTYRYFTCPPHQGRPGLDRIVLELKNISIIAICGFVYTYI